MRLSLFLSCVFLLLLCPHLLAADISEIDLEKKSLLELTLMRNAIFARHGYIFKTKWLDDYFKRQDWYKPNSQFSLSRLSVKEKSAADLLKKHEDRKYTDWKLDETLLNASMDKRENDQWYYAHSFVENGDYRRAIIEYTRYKNHFANTGLPTQANGWIGMLYELSGEKKLAIDAYNDTIENYPDRKTDCREAWRSIWNLWYDKSIDQILAGCKGKRDQCIKEILFFIEAKVGHDRRALQSKYTPNRYAELQRIQNIFLEYGETAFMFFPDFYERNRYAHFHLKTAIVALAYEVGKDRSRAILEDAAQTGDEYVSGVAKDRLRKLNGKPADEVLEGP